MSVLVKLLPELKDFNELNLIRESGAGYATKKIILADLNVKELKHIRATLDLLTFQSTSETAASLSDAAIMVPTRYKPQ